MSVALDGLVLGQLRELTGEVALHARRVERRLDAIAERLDDLERLMGRGAPAGGLVEDEAVTAPPAQAAGPMWLRRVLRGMTARQQGTLLLLLAGAQNDQIARVFGRDLSTAKSYVSAVCAKFGERRRSMVIARVMPLWEQIDDGELQAMKGLSKSWGLEALAALADGRPVALDAFD